MVKVAVGIITDTNSRVLLCQRPVGKPYPLQWEFPGGKQEDGESIEACLRRELREELGIDAVVGNLYHRQRYVYPDSGTYDVFYYIISRYMGTIRNTSFKEIRWVNVRDLPTYDILKGNTDVVQKLVHESHHSPTT
jgi:8-oxo-dGTP diphosphatase